MNMLDKPKFEDTETYLKVSGMNLYCAVYHFPRPVFISGASSGTFADLNPEYISVMLQQLLRRILVRNSRLTAVIETINMYSGVIINFFEGSICVGRIGTTRLRGKPAYALFAHPMNNDKFEKRTADTDVALKWVEANFHVPDMKHIAHNNLQHLHYAVVGYNKTLARDLTSYISNAAPSVAAALFDNDSITFADADAARKTWEAFKGVAFMADAKPYAICLLVSPMPDGSLWYAVTRSDCFRPSRIGALDLDVLLPTVRGRYAMCSALPDDGDMHVLPGIGYRCAHGVLVRIYAEENTQ